MVKNICKELLQLNVNK